MPPPFDGSMSSHLSGVRFRFPVFFAAALLISGRFETSIASDQPSWYPALEPIRKQTIILSAGTTLNGQPHLGGYFDLPRAWQAGVQIRSGLWRAVNTFEYLPQTGLQIRKLWWGDDDEESVRNSEYLGLSLGGYFGYDFQGRRTGPQPFAALSAGKYWIPFFNSPLGLDLYLELSRYFNGILPHRSQLDFLTAACNLFYKLP
jgi:hypothetical protein